MKSTYSTMQERKPERVGTSKSAKLTWGAKLTQVEVAELIGCTRQNVSIAEENALEKIRAYWKAQDWDRG